MDLFVYLVKCNCIELLDRQDLPLHVAQREHRIFSTPAVLIDQQHPNPSVGTGPHEYCPLNLCIMVVPMGEEGSTEY